MQRGAMGPEGTEVQMHVCTQARTHARTHARTRTHTFFFYLRHMLQVAAGGAYGAAEVCTRACQG